MGVLLWTGLSSSGSPPALLSVAGRMAQGLALGLVAEMGDEPCLNPAALQSTLCPLCGNQKRASSELVVLTFENLLRRISSQVSLEQRLQLYACSLGHLKSDVLFFGDAPGFSHYLVKLIPISTVLSKINRCLDIPHRR